ncbi:MAG: DUF6062 family protein [Anaerolineae bacterium]
MLPFGYFDLIETFPLPGCAICNLLQHDVQRLIDNVLWEHTNDPFILDKMRASRGLCNEHGWQFIEAAHALNVAVFYEPPLQEILKILDEAVPEPKPQNVVRRLFAKSGGSTLADALDPVQPCLVCDLQNENEARYLGIMAQHIADERLLKAFWESDGLCLPHFKMVLRRTPYADRFIRIQKDIWTRLHAELEEFTHKLAIQTPNDQIGSEANSWRRTHAVFTGGKGVFGRRR